MRISTDQETLQRGLNVVARAVATRSTLPQTSHICIATDDGRLKLSATNLEIAITNWITATVEEEGAITIPSRLLTDFIATLPSAPITLSVAAGSKRAQIVCARNDATISGMDADDFPPSPRSATPRSSAWSPARCARRSSTSSSPPPATTAGPC